MKCDKCKENFDDLYEVVISKVFRLNTCRACTNAIGLELFNHPEIKSLQMQQQQYELALKYELKGSVDIVAEVEIERELAELSIDIALSWLDES